MLAPYSVALLTESRPLTVTGFRLNLQSSDLDDADFSADETLPKHSVPPAPPVPPSIPSAIFNPPTQDVPREDSPPATPEAPLNLQPRPDSDGVPFDSSDSDR